MESLNWQMFMSKQYLIIVILLVQFSVNGQTPISGCLVDASDRKPLPYANISVAGKRIGTVSDGNGRFRLDGAGILHHDTLIIHYLGYKMQILPVGLLPPQCLAYCEVSLERDSLVLSEVLVSGYRLKGKTVKVGNGPEISYPLEVAVGDTGFMGQELGVMIRSPIKKAYLKEVVIGISKCVTEKAEFKLNVYTRSPQPKHLFDFIPVPSAEPILFTVLPEHEQVGIKLDLEQYHLEVGKNFMITIQTVHPTDPNTNVVQIYNSINAKHQNVVGYFGQLWEVLGVKPATGMAVQAILEY